jgi:hypothetical protein
VALLNLAGDEMCRPASESLDRDLGWVALRAHVLYCRACCRFRRQIKLLQFTSRRLPRHVEYGQPLPGTGLSDEVRERIKRALRGIERLRD